MMLGTFLPKSLFHLFQVLRAGQALAHPGAWKNVQLIGSLLTALLGLLWSFGIQIPLLPDDIFAIAGAVVALLNGYLTVATSKKVGLPAHESTPPDPAPGADDVRMRDISALLSKLRSEIHRPDGSSPSKDGDR